MTEVFEFSSDEVTVILWEELKRRGKIAHLPNRVSLSTVYKIHRGMVNAVQIKIGDPIPGAKEL